MTTSDIPHSRVIGTVVTPDQKKPFIYSPDEGRVELDFLHNPTQAALSDDERVALEHRIRQAVGLEVVEVRIGQYHCYDCGEWFQLDGSQWSLGMCFNCSFDRSSEIADRY